MDYKKYQVLAEENIASIRDIQKNPSKALRGVTRVMRGGKTVGFFFSNKEIDDMLEDFEATSSPEFLVRIREAREDMRLDKGVSLKQAAKQCEV